MRSIYQLASWLLAMTQRRTETLPRGCEPVHDSHSIRAAIKAARYFSRSTLHRCEPDSYDRHSVPFFDYISELEMAYLGIWLLLTHIVRTQEDVQDDRHCSYLHAWGKFASITEYGARQSHVLKSDARTMGAIGWGMTPAHVALAHMWSRGIDERHDVEALASLVILINASFGSLEPWCSFNVTSARALSTLYQSQLHSTPRESDTNYRNVTLIMLRVAQTRRRPASFVASGMSAQLSAARRVLTPNDSIAMIQRSSVRYTKSSTRTRC